MNGSLLVVVEESLAAAAAALGWVEDRKVHRSVLLGRVSFQKSSAYRDEPQVCPKRRDAHLFAASLHAKRPPCRNLSRKAQASC